MSTLTTLLRLAGWFVVAYVLAACVVAGQDREVTVSAAPEVETAGDHLTGLLEDEGYECGTEPVLTDTIVFERGTMAEVLTFDAAWAAAEAGEGNVIAYCVAGA